MKKNPIENKIYASIIAECEKLEADKVYRGNGHHLAQRLTAMVSAGILSKHQKQIFETLTNEFQSTSEIADKVKNTAKYVSAQLLQIEEQSLLISKKKIDNKNYWKKH